MDKFIIENRHQGTYLLSVKRKKLETVLFSVFIGLYPVLSSYSCPLFSRLDFGTLLTCLYLCYLLFTRFHSFTIKKHCLIPFFFYVAMLTPIMLLCHIVIPVNFEWGVFSVLLRYGKFIIVLFTLFVVFHGHEFNLSVCLKTIQMVVYIACIYVTIQQIFYGLFDLILTNPLLQIFSISGGGYMSPDYYVIHKGMLRPSAFFLEPSHMAQYCIMFLAYLLFADKIEKRWLHVSIVVCGIICTTLAVGVLAIGALLLLWFIFHKHTKKDFIIAGIAIIGLVIVLQIELIQATLERLITNQYVITGRFGAGLKQWAQLPLLYKIFGNGFGCVPSGFINGLEYILITIGFVGLLVFLGLLIYIALKAKKWQKVIILCYSVLLLGAQMFTVNYLVFIISLTKYEIYYDTSRFIIGRKKN